MTKPDRYQDAGRWRSAAAVMASATVLWSVLAAFASNQQVYCIVLAVASAGWTAGAIYKIRRLRGRTLQ